MKEIPYDPDFDREKLSLHPVEVAYWLTKGITRGPIYTEMELSTICDQDCIFCGVKHLVNRKREILTPHLARKILSELKSMGNKSVMFSGHGEPLLNPNAAEILKFSSSLMSTSLTTNGVRFNENNLHLIDGLEWMRFSINGGNAKNYAFIHHTEEETFEKVLKNIARAVKRKIELNLNVVIGTQLVLLNENAPLVKELALKLKEIGVDYFSVKPYSYDPKTNCRLKVDYSKFQELEFELKELEDERFKIIYRKGSMAKIGRKKPYSKCYGTHFFCYVSASGDIWECNVHAGDGRFLLGNAQEISLSEMWHSQRRKEILDFINEKLNPEECRDICRMDAVNRYLWRLKNPRPHDNFI